MSKAKIAKAKYDKARRENYTEEEREVVARRASKYAEDNPEKVRAAKIKHYTENKEQIKVRADELRANNPERVKATQKAWCDKNPEKVKKIKSGWKKRNLSNGSFNTAKRRASQLQRTPVWADLSDIKDVYLEAQYQQMVVDHIIPLNGKLVSGLHVWDNLQLLSNHDNCVKSNKFSAEDF